MAGLFSCNPDAARHGTAPAHGPRPQKTGRALLYTLGSIFSGIGGIDLGFERAGFEVRWQIEIDPFCRSVLARHFPSALRYSDAKTVTRPEPVHVMAGGFPCQDISFAGQGYARDGIAGKRSGLWSEYRRLIGELRPRWVLVENVAAILARGMDTVCGDLAVLGYDTQWEVIPASALGAPHNRERIWIVAHADGFRFGDLGHGYDPVRFFDRPPAPAAWPGFHHPVLSRMDDGIPHRMERVKALGNSVIPGLPKYIASRIIELEKTLDTARASQ